MTQKKVIYSLASLSILYFLVLFFANIKGSLDANMVGIFEPDEQVQLGHVFRMVRERGTIKEEITSFILYRHYFYGFPFFALSAVLLYPLRFLNLIETMPYVMVVLRQMVSVLPMLGSIAILVYLQTRFKHLLRSLFLFSFLLTIPAVTRNSFWWHPDSLTILFIVLTFFFLDRDGLRFKKHFWFAAVTCGISIGIKLIGLFFFITIPLYLLWGYLTGNLKLRKLLNYAFIFVFTMGVMVVITNPLLIFESARTGYLKTQRMQAKFMAFGFEVAYPKGPASWVDIILEFYGQWFFVLIAWLGAVIGVIKEKNKLLNALILGWGIPFTLYILYVIAIKPFHFFLPIALPVYSTILVFFPKKKEYWLNFFKFDIPRGKDAIIKLAQNAIIILILIQFGLNISWGVNYYLEELHKEENNPSISFYNQVSSSIIAKIPKDEINIIYRDVRMYVPNTLPTISKFELLDYDYFNAQNPALILLMQQRIYDYTIPSAVNNPSDPEQMALSFVFYTDANEENLENYVLIARDEFGLAYVREDIYNAYWSDK